MCIEWVTYLEIKTKDILLSDSLFLVWGSAVSDKNKTREVITKLRNSDGNTFRGNLCIHMALFQDVGVH